MVTSNLFEHPDSMKSPNGMRPSSRSISLSTRPSSSRDKSSRLGRSSSFHGTPKRVLTPAGSESSSLLSRPRSVLVSSRPQLSSPEVEFILRQKVTENYNILRRSFGIYDSSCVNGVTKGEFRRVLDNYCLPLTTEQFKHVLIKVGLNVNGSVPYERFLELYSGKSRVSSARPSLPRTPMRNGWMGSREGSRGNRRSRPDQNVDAVERVLRQKIAMNLEALVKSFRFFDYNIDGHVQRHEFRRILESNCFKLSDLQFAKLCSRYDLSHNGTVDYRDFIRRLGVSLDGGIPRERNTSPVDSNKQPQEKIILTPIQSKPPTPQSPSSGKLSISSVEKEFRKKMRDDNEKLRQAMSTFDKNEDGFIEIEDLKAVLDNFVFPTTFQVFQTLMQRSGIRATGKVSWTQFLSKFQDPLSSGNGQTLPIGQNHKVNPIRQSNESVSPRDLFNRLHDHFSTHYSTLRDAFLKVDQSNNGFILRSDLKRILKHFPFKLDDAKYDQLFRVLDPQNTGMIPYHQFLSLFETKESLNGHKWLNSQHRVNDQIDASTPSLKICKEILHDNLSRKYKQVVEDFSAIDKHGNGTITKKKLRHLVDKHAMPMSDEHFECLWNDCSETQSGKIFFSDFLNSVGVEANPGDFLGPSTKIQFESDVREEKRIDELNCRMKEIDQVDENHTKFLSANAVISILRDKMSQHDSNIRKTFLRHTGTKQGFITRNNLVKMLEDMGFRMEKSQFEDLMMMLRFSKSGMSYPEFVSNFEDLRTNGLNNDMKRMKTEKGKMTNSIRYMSAIDCYQILSDRIKSNPWAMRQAFMKYDIYRNGRLTISGFKRLLDRMMFIMTDETFQELLVMLKLKSKKHLTFQQLESIFIESQDTSPCMLQPTNNKISRVTSHTMAAEQVIKCLKVKAQQTWATLASAFKNFDSDGNGTITRKDIQAVCFKFNLPMNPSEFDKLWKSFDKENKGFISHRNFVEKLGLTFTPGDQEGLQGTSQKIHEENDKTLRQHQTLQHTKHEELTNNQISFVTNNLTAEQVQQELKDRFRENYTSFDQAFKSLDRNRDGYITINDFRRILRELNYFLSSEQFERLLQILDLPCDNSRLSYFDFLRAIDEGRASKHNLTSPTATKATTRDPNLLGQFYSQLPGERVMEKLKDIVSSQLDSLHSVFGAFDRAKTGHINITDFRRIIDNFCIRLTDKQFKILLTRCQMRDGKVLKLVDWVTFLNEFNRVHGQFSVCLATKGQQIGRDCVDLDHARNGLIGKNDFRKVIESNFQKMSDSEFDLLWSKQKVNQLNNLNYLEFLSKNNVDIEKFKMESPNADQYLDDLEEELQGLDDSGDMELEKQYDVMSPSRGVVTPPSRPMTGEIGQFELQGQAVGSRQEGRCTSTTGSAARSTSVHHSSNLEDKVRDVVLKKWKVIQKNCRALDSGRRNSVTAQEFLGVLEKHGVSLSLSEGRTMFSKFEVAASPGNILYKSFLKHFLLDLHPIEQGITERKYSQKSRIPVIFGKETDAFCDVMVTLRERLLRCWKEMRRTFRTHDVHAIGFVNPKVFRKVLEEYSIRLSEEDFFNLMSYYDKNLEGRIAYNEFLRAFLHN